MFVSGRFLRTLNLKTNPFFFIVISKFIFSLYKLIMEAKVNLLNVSMLQLNTIIQLLNLALFKLNLYSNLLKITNVPQWV